MKPLLWHLGSELQYSLRAVQALNHRAIRTALDIFVSTFWSYPQYSLPLAVFIVTMSRFIFLTISLVCPYSFFFITQISQYRFKVPIKWFICLWARCFFTRRSSMYTILQNFSWYYFVFFSLQITIKHSFGRLASSNRPKKSWYLPVVNLIHLNNLNFPTSLVSAKEDNFVMIIWH